MTGMQRLSERAADVVAHLVFPGFCRSSRVKLSAGCMMANDKAVTNTHGGIGTNTEEGSIDLQDERLIIQAIIIQL